MRAQFLPVRSFCLVLGLLGLLVLQRPIYAQSSTAGAIAGSLSDQQGKRLAGAHVVLHSLATAFEREASADAAGSYRFAEVPPGRYWIEASAAGFAPWRAEGVTVEVGRLTMLNAVLAIGSAQQSVSVRSEAPYLDTTTAAVTNNVDQTAIENLPSNGRRWSNFALLAPGVTPDLNGFGLLSFRGISVLLNNNTIDGADNNQAFFSEERGRTRIGYSTSQASVEEFQVNTSNYSSEYGRAAGGVVNTVTKSGGNKLHGQLFFYDRDAAWGATNPYTTLTTRNAQGIYITNPYQAKDIRQQWGLGAGGPIRKDKLFWFFTYDQFKRDFPGIAQPYQPAKLYSAPSAQTIQTLAARTSTTPAVALANYNAVLHGLNSLLGIVPRTGDQTIYFPKVDWQAGERDHFTFQYNRMRWTSLNGVQTETSLNYGAASFGNDFVKEDWGIVRWEHFLSENLLNEARYQYGRDDESELSGPPAPFEQAFSNNVYGKPPQVSLVPSSYGFRFGKPALLDRIAYPNEARNQFIDTLTWIHGAHTVKAGYDYDYVNDYSNAIYDQNGTYDYANIENFVADLLSPNHCNGTTGGVGNLPCYSYFQQGIGPTIFQFQSADYAAFLADEWKLRPNLTFSYGVRYEYERLPNTNRKLVNPDIAQTAKLPHDKNNFGPRLGLAWDIFGSGQSVLRAGVGIYYGRIVNSTAFTALTSTGMPNSQRIFFYRPTDLGAPPFPYVFNGTPVLSIQPDAVYFDTHFQNPQITQTELSFEQELGRGTVLSFTYMGSFGHELPNFVDTNISLTNVGTITYNISDATGKGPLHNSYTTRFYTTRINPNYQQITDIFSETNSVYHAGVMKLSHRMARFLDLQGAYTFARALDYNQNESTFADRNDLLDPANFRLEYGNSNFDIRHRVSGGGVARVPWHLHGPWGAALNGYLLSSTVELRTGLPFSMRTLGSIPSLEYVDSVNRIQKLEGLGPSINGSGGDNRIAEVGRNTFRYPRVYNVAARFAKNTKLNERVTLQMLAEVFNVLNHPNVTHIDTIGYVIDGGTTPGGNAHMTYESGAHGTSEFNTITNANSNTLYSQRQIQIAFKLSF